MSYLTEEQTKHLAELEKKDHQEAEYYRHQLVCQWINAQPEHMQGRLWMYQQEIDKIRNSCTTEEFQQWLAGVTVEKGQDFLMSHQKVIARLKGIEDE